MARPNEFLGQPLSVLAKAAAIVAAVALGCTALMLLLWQAASAILIILIGMLFAAIFDGGARGLGVLVPVHRKIRLVVVIAAILALVSFVVWWSGSTIVQEAGQFSASVRQVIDRVASGFPAGGIFGDSGIDLSNLIPSATTLFGGATRAVTTTFGVVVTVALILFLGIFFAWEPEVYKRGLLSLLPRRARPRVGEVLDRSAEAMRGWLIGQAISMAVIFVFTLCALLLIGMPFSVLLATLAGLLSFVPTIGPFAAGMLIVLAGLSVGIDLALYGLAVYLVIQFLESNLLTPIVQERTVRLPAASTLSIQLIAGVFFGLLGIAFAIPLAAAAKVLIEELYVKDQLGGAWNEGAIVKAKATPERRRRPAR
jgi:predicted PurR-regulated permease PerM